MSAPDHAATQDTSDEPKTILEAVMASPLARLLIVSIVVMTLAMVFMAGMILGALIAPGRVPPPPAEVVAAELDEMVVVLPKEAAALDVVVVGERVVVRYVGADGALGLASIPAPDGAARVRVQE